MSADTPEQRELTLVGKVELRIALADSDAKLQSLLNTYLPPLLLKLTSDHEKVRFAVREEPSTRYRIISGFGRYHCCISFTPSSC